MIMELRSLSSRYLSPQKIGKRLAPKPASLQTAMIRQTFLAKTYHTETLNLRPCSKTLLPVIEAQTVTAKVSPLVDVCERLAEQSPLVEHFCFLFRVQGLGGSGFRA